jgi:hypothetical protein
MNSAELGPLKLVRGDSEITEFALTRTGADGCGLPG